MTFMSAFALTVIAGLATSVGGLLGVLGRSDNRRLLALSLGFAAGVMVYVSLVEILPTGSDLLECSGLPAPGWLALLAFFVGIGATVLLDVLLPEVSHTSPPRTTATSPRVKEAERRRLMRLGLVTAAVLAAHNFPEGFATLMAGLSDPRLGLPVAVAIAIHNIPEGIAVAAPLYRATRSRRRAFWLATASGVSEPLGALVGYLLLRPFLGDALLGLVFCGIAGIMVHLSLNDLVPTAHEFSDDAPHAATGLVLGMATMGVSLVLL